MKIQSNSKVIFGVFVLLLLAAFLFSGETKTGNTTPQQPDQQEMMKMMAPMMGQMMESMMEGMLNALAKPETAKKLADFSKNYFDELIAKGFSRDEAIQIITAVGFPSVPSMK